MHAILTSIEFQMSLLLFVALAGYLIAYRINQSAVVGIILAGIVVGPSFLHLVTYTDFVAGLARAVSILRSAQATTVRISNDFAPPK